MVLIHDGLWLRFECMIDVRHCETQKWRLCTRGALKKAPAELVGKRDRRQRAKSVVA